MKQLRKTEVVKPDFSNVGDKLQVDILGEMYDATVIEESPYDSENNLLLARLGAGVTFLQ